MKIKKIYIELEQKESSLAILHDERWIILKHLLKQFPDDTSEQYSKLVNSSDDLIAFLQVLPQAGEKLNTLLKKANIDNCCQSEGMKEIIPFRPLLYRDFMVCERHVINSSRGMVKNTMKKVMPIVNAYEKIFRRPFPAFYPQKPFYENPIYYKGNHLSFVGSDTTVVYPEYATLLDYELELGMIITKNVYNATEEEGLDAIGAFCVFNDFSARNVQYTEMKQTGFGPCKAKDFASAISNIVVTPDEVLPYLETLKTRVFINDKLVAEGQMNEFYHSLGKVVAYASKGERVYAGEFMGSGTIPNCSGLENGQFLKRGDTIRLEIDKIGDLTNTISKDFIQLQYLVTS